MMGLTFTFFMECENAKEIMVISLSQVYRIHSGASGFPLHLNREKKVCSFKSFSISTLMSDNNTYRILQPQKGKIMHTLQQERGNKRIM